MEAVSYNTIQSLIKGHKESRAVIEIETTDSNFIKTLMDTINEEGVVSHVTILPFSTDIEILSYTKIDVSLLQPVDSILFLKKGSPLLQVAFFESNVNQKKEELTTYTTFKSDKNIFSKFSVYDITDDRKNSSRYFDIDYVQGNPYSVDDKFIVSKEVLTNLVFSFNQTYNSLVESDTKIYDPKRKRKTGSYRNI